VNALLTIAWAVASAIAEALMTVMEHPAQATVVLLFVIVIMLANIGDRLGRMGETQREIRWAIPQATGLRMPHPHILLHWPQLPGHEWAGHTDPEDPDNFWVDDETGERVDARP
jgi:hypothetical protein